MKINNQNNASYFAKHINNYNEHLAIWQQLHNKIHEALANIKINPSQQQITNQLDQTTFEFGMQLSNLAASGLDLNIKSKALIIDENQNDYQIAKHLESLLIDCYGISTAEEFYPFLSELIKFTKSEQLAMLSLFNNYEQLLSISEGQLEINPFEFMFINAFNGYKSCFFYHTQQASAIVFLLRIGYQLQWVNDDILTNITQVIGMQITERFNNWYEFLYNYILAMVFDNLDQNNPNNALLVAEFWIIQLQSLIQILNLHQIDPWIRKVIKYVE